MTSIEDIIKLEVNPFDSVTWRFGNFWQEEEKPGLTVDSIHQQEIAEIKEILAQVAKDHCTRTLMLYGDSGSGKSYLLGRLKRTLNATAFFVYIEPFTTSDRIWQHILRYTVDSLVKVPDGEQESQLLLWSKSLSEFKQSSSVKQIADARKAFIKNLRDTYPTDIENANEFFGVLYDLLLPDLHRLACDWLRGDDLDRDDLKKLGVNSSVNNEDAARNILSNFGRLFHHAKPIVLCFDQLDNIARLPDGNIDLQSLFNVNSIVHNLKLKNFLVIISIMKSTWQQNANRIQPADRARIDVGISLKSITLEQAEALWESRLHQLHQQADEKPTSLIYPLTRKELEKKFPGGRTYPRNVLQMGSHLFKAYKAKLVTSDGVVVIKPEKPDFMAAFQLVWQKEFQKTQTKFSRIRQFSSTDLIGMLQESFAALQVGKIRTKFLQSPTYASYSLTYQPPGKSEPLGIVWAEDPNLTSFFHVIKACQTAINQKQCQILYLIRAEKLGDTNNQGYKRYVEIFKDSHHYHIIPDLTSVHYLATYHSMVNSATSGELVIADKTPKLIDLQTLIRQSEILHDCRLLKHLGIVPKGKNNGKNGDEIKHQQAKQFLLNLVIREQFMGRQILIANTCDQFPEVDESEMQKLIQQLCQEKRIEIINPKEKIEAQSVCLVLNNL